MTYTDEESLLSPFHPKFKNKKGSKTKEKYVPIASDSDVSDQSTEDMVAKTEPPKKKIPALGIILAFMSVIVYSLGSAIVNLLPELHSIEILVIRALFQFISFGGITFIRGYSIRPAEGHHWDLVLRCISGTITLCTVFVAYRLMPLADASTIQFSSPVFVAIFGYFMLKESLSILQGLAGVVTLAGVVIIAQPEFIFGPQDETVYDNRIWGTVLAVVSSVSGAFSMIALRKLKTTPVSVIVMWFSALVIIVGIVILAVLDELVLPIGWYTWGLLIGVGVCGVADQYFVSKAMQYEGAGPVSVTRTSTVVMTFIWEAVILGQTVEWLSMIGASLITVCVLVLALDKWRKESPKTFERLYNCCSVSDDFYDAEEHKTNLSDSFNTFYDSIGQTDRQDSKDGTCNPFVVVDGAADKSKNQKNECQSDCVNNNESRAKTNTDNDKQ